MKEWIDQVFQYGFAFGKDSYQLENKKLISSFTIGSPISLYPNDVIQNITFPFRGLSDYCKMNYIGEVFCNDINGYSPEAKENAIRSANEHIQKLLTLNNT